MGFFDTLLTAIAPERAVKRVAAQTAIRAINSGYSNYGASLHKKSMRGWMWHGGSPKEDIEDNIPYKEIIDYLNEKAGTQYRYKSKKTKEKIKARYNVGFAIDDFNKVIDIKCDEWLSDPKMCKYIRPETLFGNKFESYLNKPTPMKTNKQLLEWYENQDVIDTTSQQVDDDEIKAMMEKLKGEQQ